MLTGKLHRARVTDCNIDYEGSVEIDENLMDEVGLKTYEQVHIYDINNGNRIITYVIPGKRGGGKISVNGAAARQVETNDRIIIAAYGIIDVEKADDYQPRLVLLDENNNVVKVEHSVSA